MLGSERVVLCVEDEVFVRMFVADALVDAGFRVLEAGCAAEALSILQTRDDVQALVTDVDMPPGMNGFALARSVSERWSNIPIIVLSGRFSPKPWRSSQGQRLSR
jgi:CheY-like chemotaxis protein